MCMISAAPVWDCALGLEGGSDELAIAFGDETAIGMRMPESRSTLRAKMNELRESNVDCVLILCSGQPSDETSDEIFVIEDHVNWSGDNPLIGMRHSEAGNRFVDMTDAYHAEFCAALHDAATVAGIAAGRGVAVDAEAGALPTTLDGLRPFATVSGLAMAAIAARQAGLRVAGVAWIGGDSPGPDGTLAAAKGYDILEGRRFLELAAHSIHKISGVQ